MYGIFTYIYHKDQRNVGIYIYIPYMDHMGKPKAKASSYLYYEVPVFQVLCFDPMKPLNLCCWVVDVEIGR